MKFRRKLVLLWMTFSSLVYGAYSAAGNSRAHIINQDPVIIIKEDTAVGTLVYTLIGDDPENDVMTYSLDATGTELFTLVKTENTKAELRLKKTLNRELTANYEFKAFVTDDVNNADKKTEKALFVTVLDANDNVPIFTEQPYRKSIAENTTVNTNLLTIKAVDADSAANAAVQYRFSNDSSSDIQFKSLWETDKFKIDNVNGHITLTGALDFEKTSRYVLTVIAEDRGSPPQKSETTVVFDVTDISDMPPKFEQSIYITEINENSPKNTSVIKVTARDGDTGVDNPIKYEIYQGNQGGAFAIDSSSGQITVNGTIDAENIQSYTLYIRASEVPDPSSNTTVKVLITVIDKNDNPPILSQHSYYFPVREDQAIPGRIVTNQLLVTDADRNPDYRRFTYALTGVDSTKFSINPNSGILKINSTLDYEKQINFTFTIVVTETGTAEKFSDNATVLLTLINVNDNEPKFQQSSYNYTFAEEIPAGSFIAKITATDDDSGTYGEVTYSLKGLDVEYFQVNTTNGNIIAAKTLDFETKQNYQFNFLAKDGGGLIDFIERSVTVNVALTDVNDNAPIFTQSSYSKNIDENLPANTVILSMTATDKDSGELGRVSYTIVEGNIDNAFQINSSGVISTTKPLDRETTASYTIKVKAYDHGLQSRNTTVDVTVTVNDENDNTPYIAQGPDIYVNISEAAGGGTEVLASIPATDADIGSNKKLIYDMQGSDGRFILNSETGRLQISPTGLDRETKSSYDLVINITDQGSPPRFNTTTVHITILDVNDNAPEFKPKQSESPSTYIVTVIEGPNTVNATIININATDKDDASNAKILYELTSGDEHGFFNLDPNSGVLSAKKELDRENDQMPKDSSGKGRFFLDIKATDQAPPSLQKSATIRVTVYVDDINDNAPTFTENIYKITTSEATLERTNLLQVSADDKDLDNKGRVSYNITNGDPLGNFEITSSGVIVIKSALDAELVPMYNLTVTASDHGNPPMTSQTYVVINVDDVNDNDPAFNQTKYTANVKENVPQGTSVTRVFAEDKDKGVNGKIIYKISNGNRNGAFSINNVTGVISTAASIDRETISSYLLTVQAEDEGLPSSRKDFAEVEITVEDENDQDPVFGESSYTGEIAENSPQGTSLKMDTAIKATDKDIGDNAKISFKLSGLGSENFLINSTTAVITTSSSSSLDREKNDSYTFTVTAIDGGGRNTTVQLTVTITDVNDESPRFSSNIYYANVSEDASRGFNVRRVTATDNDLGINKQIIYTSTGADAKFYIDRSTGDIKLDSKLDREFKKLYILNITAANIIGNVPDGHAQVYITVTDVIDDKPYFTSPSVTTQLLENAALGTNVTMVTASDKDIGDTLTYKILSGDSYGQFSIENTTGQITTVKSLDRENTTQYTLVVEAKDSIGLAATLNVIINVLDVNDNAPVFKPGGFIVDYREQSPKGTSVMTVSAVDADEGINAQIRFSIVENVTDYIEVDPETGVITQAEKELDRELYSFFNFTVKATDQGAPPRYSTVKVALNLIDINDHNPSFLNKTFYATVKENQPGGTFVIQITATDKDIGSNAALNYGLEFSDDSLAFRIDPVTGNITTRANVRLDRERQDTYNIRVRAEDKAIRPREGSTTLIVTVLDDNDHTPVFTETDYSFNVNENVPIGTKVDGKVSATDNDINENAKLSYSIIGGNQKPPNWFLTYNLSWPFNSISHKTIQGSTKGTTRGNITIVSGPGTPALNLNGINADIKLEEVQKTCVADPDICSEGMSIIVWLKLDSLADTYSKHTREGFILSSGAEMPSFRGVAVHLSDSKIHVTLSTRLNKLYCNATYVKDKWTLVTITWSKASGLKLYCNTVLLASCANGMTVTQRTAVSNKLYVGRSVGDQANHAGFSISSLSVQYGLVNLEDIQRILVSDNAFVINNVTGEITTASKLDRETNASFVLIVKVQDHGSPQRESNSTVTITIKDYNDNAPRFTQATYNATLAENRTPGPTSQVITVSATDADEGTNSEFTFKIESGDVDNVFLLNEQTGKLTLKGKLDHETTNLYRLNISAKDQGSPSLKGYTLVLVKVLDIDDNPPKFTKAEYTADILENATQWSIVAQVNATDQDTSAEHNTIHYSIESGNIGGMFSIGEFNGTVELKCSECLDRETIASYELTVAAKSFINNTEQKSTVKLKITVLDVNDMPPVFIDLPYKKQVPEDDGDISGVQNVLTISATDRDIGINAEVFYTIVSGNEKGYFTLNNISGQLTKLKPLDREETASFLLVVKAIDKGVPPLSTTANVSLSIRDRNDNSPNFTTVGAETYRVKENITIGTQITQFKATDIDEGNNGMVEFVILSGDNEGAFKLDSVNGTLKTAKELDHETTPLYQLIIQAKDKGSPSLATQKEVKIIVTDLNDNIPKFTAGSVSFTVNENLAAGAIVGTVKANDFDKTDNVYYYIIDGINEFFALDEDTGTITTKKTLDREERATYILDIKASNYKLDPATLQPRVRKRRAASNSSEASPIQRITINIGDTNDNGPAFKSALYTGGVSDSIKHGARALLVTATDADSGNNSKIAYSITSSEFRVEKDTGWIRADTSFAKDTGQLYTFTIVAKDNNGVEPCFNATATVKIYVLVDTQRAVLISGRQPEEVRLNQDEFKSVLENITDFIINIDDINYYRDEKGKYYYDRTGLLFHAVDPTTNRIVDRDLLIQKIDENYSKRKAFFSEWKIKEIKEYVPPPEVESVDWKLILAIGLGVLLIFLICLFCCVIALLRKRQGRRLRAAQAQSYGGSTHVSRRSSISTLPNTNLHNADGSNPIWVDPYQNWGLDVDEDDYQTIKSKDSLSNGVHYYSDIKIKPNTTNPLFQSQEAYMSLDFDANESADVDLSTFGRSTFPKNNDSDNRTPSPEPYESSPQSDRHLYDNPDDKYQVTSI